MKTPGPYWRPAKATDCAREESAGVGGGGNGHGLPRLHISHSRGAGRAAIGAQHLPRDVGAQLLAQHRPALLARRQLDGRAVLGWHLGSVAVQPVPDVLLLDAYGGSEGGLTPCDIDSLL